MHNTKLEQAKGLMFSARHSLKEYIKSNANDTNINIPDTHKIQDQTQTPINALYANLVIETKDSYDSNDKNKAALDNSNSKNNASEKGNLYYQSNTPSLIQSSKNKKAYAKTVRHRPNRLFASYPNKLSSIYGNQIDEVHDLEEGIIVKGIKNPNPTPNKKVNKSKVLSGSKLYQNDDKGKVQNNASIDKAIQLLKKEILVETDRPLFIKIPAVNKAKNGYPLRKRAMVQNTQMYRGFMRVVNNSNACEKTEFSHSTFENVSDQKIESAGSKAISKIDVRRKDQIN